MKFKRIIAAALIVTMLGAGVAVALTVPPWAIGALGVVAFVLNTPAPIKAGCSVDSKYAHEKDDYMEDAWWPSVDASCYLRSGRDRYYTYAHAKDYLSQTSRGKEWYCNKASSDAWVTWSSYGTWITCYNYS